MSKVPYVPAAPLATLLAPSARGNLTALENPKGADRVLETDYFMTPEDVAAFLLIKEKTLANWRSDREPKGPKFRRFGNRIRYIRSDVLAWAEEQGHRIVSSHGATAPKKKDTNQTRRKAALTAITKERDALWERLAVLNDQEEALN